ncbi:hypothetical protein VT52_013355 [Streptomyces malaysiense]|uniref:Uncharacterized protein n=1 Tax=Streptomyces malaysiense TaxID=1428626 RepID=A0A1J4Q2C2_9ACTN|nr:hypothetical protein VT52_013355 [Streptomyces malaysiense]
MTGYEQVHSVAAARVELNLPETGVCDGAELFDEADTTQSGSCCSAPAAPQLIALGATALESSRSST